MQALTWRRLLARSLSILLCAAVLPASQALARQAPPARPRPQLTIAPESGVVGTTFALSGADVPAGATVEVQWTSWSGMYWTETTSVTVAYKQRAFTEKRISLGQVTADGEGRFGGSFTVPEDFGHLHDIHAVVDGQDAARSAFEVLMDGSASPEFGPVGTPIHIHITGLNPNLFSGSTLALRYDNAYTGVLTATTTSGTADAVIRSTGPVGLHSILVGAGTSPAYLNIHQSPYDFLYAHLPGGEAFQFGFTTTADRGPPADAVEWPAANSVIMPGPGAPRTTFEPLAESSVQMRLEPATGPIMTLTHLVATGLHPNLGAGVVWMTARGNRVSDSGWDLTSSVLGQGNTDERGTLSLDVQIPDDLGGWHELRVVQEDTPVAQAPFYLERSLLSVSPTRPRAGDIVTIHVKGLGWTELDNGFAVTYDNNFVGYACGFNSNGDVTMPLVASGGPGTHLIDLYPMVYAGQDRKPWYWAPVLTFGQDFPALGLGYRLPAFRLAIDAIQ